MWHYLYVVWLHLDASAIWPLTAIVILLDAITGLSRRISGKFDMQGRGDLVLLVLMMLAAIALWLGVGFLDLAYQEANHLGISDNPSARARDAAWQSLADGYRPLLEAVVLISVISGPFLAHYKGRSFAQWTALSLLGNIGAIVWLLMAPRKDASVAAAGAAR